MSMRGTPPAITVNREKLLDNARTVKRRCQEHGIGVTPVTKVTCGHPEVASVLLEAGFGALADSRLENLARLRRHFPRVRLHLLRLPMMSQVSEVVRTADVSLNSDITTIKALDRAARAQGKVHDIILMVDVGDLREGIWPDQIDPVSKELSQLESIRAVGLGTNLACYGGVCPSADNMRALLEAAESLAAVAGFPPTIISGGNSANWLLMESGHLPPQINNLRLGEVLFLGQETTQCRPVPGLHGDVFTLETEVIESQIKPSAPVGETMRDAFGQVPRFEDRGLRRRAIVAVGRQDVVPEGLAPALAGVEILGASSDHMILDVHEAPREIRTGDSLSFTVSSYSALLALFTSPYVSVKMV